MPARRDRPAVASGSAIDARLASLADGMMRRGPSMIGQAEIEAKAIEFDIHHHSPTAHRRFIEAALDQVKTAVGRGHDDEGEIVTPAIGAASRAVIGSWAIVEDAS